ncbi:hypothetical protein [Desulfosarcina ovata]|uniref:hypothetical protein n=1 Tax=Desulfosarcina ovata TaxID=83564 RepID=UPI0012D2D24D|nr:hypothetical protein [Desulfosarcina ovata]
MNIAAVRMNHPVFSAIGFFRHKRVLGRTHGTAVPISSGRPETAASHPAAKHTPPRGFNGIDSSQHNFSPKIKVICRQPSASPEKTQQRTIFPQIEGADDTDNAQVGPAIADKTGIRYRCTSGDRPFKGQALHKERPGA